MNIEELLQELENTYQVKITVHDYRGLLTNQDGSRLLPGRHLHRHAYCVQGRYTVTGWENSCFKDCFKDAELRASQSDSFFIKSCWKGVNELVVPIYSVNMHVMTIFCGVFRTEDSKVPDDIDEKSAEIFAKIPYLDDEKINSLKTIIPFVGKGIIHYLQEQKEVSQVAESRKELIIRYLHYHAHDDIGLDDIANYLCLSPSRASHVIKRATDLSFQALLTRERMQRARVLLVNSQTELAEIAERVGIKNVYYFNRIFKKFYGIPPGKYRKLKHHNK